MLEQLAKNSAGKVLFMRHALAPGFGDPDNFVIGDCATQRNLDEEGRQQARVIGERLKQANIRPLKLYSSQWCRCLDTASLLSLGSVEAHKGLNSFFQGKVNRQETLASLQELLQSLDYTQGPYMFVTHQVVITAVTGISPASGEIVVYDLVNKQVSLLDFKH